MPTRSTIHTPAPLHSSRKRDWATRATRLVLAVPQESHRKVLRASLDAGRGFEIVAEAHDSDSAVRFAHAHNPCVLVLDSEIPGADTLDVITAILEESPRSRIVVLTTREEPALVRECMRAGALGYVLKWRIHDELPEAIRRVSLGRAYLTPRLGARLAAESGHEPLPGRPLNTAG